MKNAIIHEEYLFFSALTYSLIMSLASDSFWATWFNILVAIKYESFFDASACSI